MVRFPYTALLVCMLIVGGSVLALSGEDREGGNPRGNRAASAVSRQGSGNANPQWLADPERGWLRVEKARREEKDRPLKVDFNSKRR